MNVYSNKLLFKTALATIYENGRLKKITVYKKSNEAIIVGQNIFMDPENYNEFKNNLDFPPVLWRNDEII